MFAGLVCRKLHGRPNLVQRDLSDKEPPRTIGHMTTRYDPTKPIFKCITEGVARDTFVGAVVASGCVAADQPLAGKWFDGRGSTSAEAMAALYRSYHSERPWSPPLAAEEPVAPVSTREMIESLVRSLDLARAQAQSEMLRSENLKVAADTERVRANEWLVQLHDERKKPMAQLLAKEEARAQAAEELETLLQLVVDSVDWAGKNRVPTHAPLFLAVHDLLKARR